MDKLQELKNIVKILEDRPTRAEMARAIKTILDFVKQMKLKDLLSGELKQTESNLNSTLLRQILAEAKKIEDRVSKDVDTRSTKTSNELTRAINRLGRTLKEELEDTKGRIPEPTDLEPVYEKINNLRETLTDKDTEILKKVGELEDEIKRVASLPRGGGGVSAMGVRQAFKYILHTEEPTGAINGSNTEYTVSKTIFAVLSFSLNGETIAQLPNYTIVGNKITFTSALPAAYADKDFEVKYIG